MIKKALQIFFLNLLAWSLTVAPSANAAFYNFGTLDVQPVHQAAAENSDWFIEYMNPGEQKQQSMRVSNFSSETKELIIYGTDTAVNEGKAYYTKSVTEKSDDVADWIDLPTKQLTLGPGESKILSANFRLPKNAGVGLHTGAIVVRENGKEFAAEKGIRVYLNVIGPAIEKATVQKVAASQTASAYSLNVTTQNLGTTDYKTGYALHVEDIFGERHGGASSSIRVEPQTQGSTSLSFTKPSFGLYHLFLSADEEKSYITTVLFVPFWMPLIGLIMLLAVIRPQIPELRWKKLVISFRTPQLRQSFAYLGLFIIIAAGAISSVNTQKDLAKAQIARGQSVREITPANEAATSYELTVKWGEFRKVLLPGEKRKEWHGRLYFPNARIKTTTLHHFERTDQAEVVGNKTAVRFDAVTGPDNDGITIFVEPVGNEIPTVRYENYESGEDFEFLITDYLDSSGIFPDRFWATEFKTEYGEQERMRLQALELTTLRELGATPELEATPHAVAQIPELENLFVEELPATPEVLTDFILKSDYVEQIIAENSTTKIETDSILIKALEATPDVLTEIVATPDLNFIFIPTETVNFPAQEFSFNEDKDSEQELGTLIFVQNKQAPWNTFIGTTNFELLSGTAVIPASALTILPGMPAELTGVNGARLSPGPNRNLTGEFDRATLVTVDPSPGQKKAFVLNPKLKIRIPRNTPAGTYRGELTITSL